MRYTLTASFRFRFIRTTKRRPVRHNYWLVSMHGCEMRGQAFRYPAMHHSLPEQLAIKRAQ